MKKISFLHVAVFSLSAVFVFLTDRIFKYYVMNFLDRKIPVIPEFFEITYQTNPGIAFSINLPFLFQMILFPILMIAGIYLIITHLNYKKPLVLIMCGIIFGGALSNFTDRIMHGSVIDYISVSVYPVFNVADVAITLGIFLIIVFYGKIKRVV
jgi:signal peptidase II